MSSEARSSIHVPTVAVSVIGSALVGGLMYLRSEGLSWPWLMLIAAAFAAVAAFVYLQSGGTTGIANPKDFYTGILLLAVCGVFAAGMFELPFGRLARPGPRFFPLMLLGLLFVFSVAILFNGLRTKGEPVGPVPWRGLIIVTGMTVFFGATIKGLGFIPSVAITAFISCMASRQWTPLAAIVTAVVLTLFTWMIFIWGLGLPIAPCGTWFRYEALLPIGNWIHDAATALGISPRFIPVCY